ncbi:F-box only protein 2 isoform X2 [Ambystoma mexicanum]
MDTFPDSLLTRVLALLPARDLVLICRLVCHQWKEMIDGGAVWELKCQQEGFQAADPETEQVNWQTCYFLNKNKRNLIRNPCGEEEFEFWTKEEDGGDAWNIESLPGDNGVEFPGEGVHKYFVTSYEHCSKSQTIDLLAEGFGEDLLDNTQPNILVEDWYAARTDAGCLYELCVQLLGENQDVLAEFKTDEPVTIEQFSDGNWSKISHTFSGYGPGVRFVKFQHGGQDSLYWKGWFGVRVTNSSVVIEA